MSKTALKRIIIVVSLVTVAIIAFGVKIFDLDSAENAQFISSLLGGVLGGAVALLGISLSHCYDREVNAETKLQEKMPYIVVSIMETITKEECEERDLRFPWGGDPEPQDTYSFWFEHKDNDMDNETTQYCRTYFLLHLKNVGYGLAQDIQFIDDRVFHDEHQKAYEDLIEDKQSGEVDIYVVFDYGTCLINDTFERGFCLTFYDLYGNKYSQKVLFYIWFHDNSIHTIKWRSEKPILIEKAGDLFKEKEKCQKSMS